MFETEYSQADKPARSPADRVGEATFPPAPFFLLALGVGLLIGLAMLAVGGRRQ